MTVSCVAAAEIISTHPDFLNPAVTNLGDQWTDLCLKAAAHALP
ncbi:protein of unknown function [Bradyrhizobium vignae]|uniref:Uncharacterized protein n=1 Tax=Bradyrhizobium vignae TaxID=1549949 RepID=A0A2U3PX32_9BRAD|nr:protein of unknown function [Bradyrhizobium vignae]